MMLRGSIGWGEADLSCRSHRVSGCDGARGGPGVLVTRVWTILVLVLCWHRGRVVVGGARDRPASLVHSVLVKTPGNTLLLLQHVLLKLLLVIMLWCGHGQGEHGSQRHIVWIVEIEGQGGSCCWGGCSPWSLMGRSLHGWLTLVGSLKVKRLLLSRGWLLLLPQTKQQVGLHLLGHVSGQGVVEC